MNTAINALVRLQIMCRRFVVALVLALLSQGAAALDVGAPLPPVSLPTQTSTVDLNALNGKGKVLYVDFWASWCGPCKQSFPWMNEMQAKYAARGLEVVAINVDAKVADAERFLQTTPAKFTVAFDAKGVSPKQFAVKAMPTSYLVGRDGKVLLIHAGFRDADRAALEAAMVAALAAPQTQGTK
jgi:cytochrome c biogenesis protein CcmG, thiol:disulfide interchange protein DsbE